MKKIILLSISLLITILCHGQQWSYQAGGYGLGGNLQGVHKVSPQLYFIQSYPMMRSGDAGETWQYVTHAGDIFTATKPSFIDESTGWCGGAKVDMYSPPNGPFGAPYLSQVLKTTDGGRSWTALTVSGLSGLNVSKFIHFFDQNMGILAGETIDFALVLFKTVDGGKTWTRKFSSDELFSVVDGQFITSSTGYISSSNGIIKTADGGETWQVLPNPADPAKNQSIVKQSFISASHGWVSGSGNLLAQTSDGGNTWISVASSLDEGGTVDESGIYITGLKFFDAVRGYISSMYGKLLYTDNGGATWQERTPENVDFGYSQDIAFMGDVGQILFITSGDGILTSSNAGITWEKQLDPFISDSQLLDITFANSSSGWAVGFSGTLLHTTDGGVHWDRVKTPAWETETQSWQTLHSVAVQHENNIWAAGENGTLLRTINGTDWTAQTVGEKDFYDIFFLKGTDKGWLVGEDYTLLYFNGEDWQAQIEAHEDAPSLMAVFFLNTNTGWAVGENGTILKSTDGGAHWNLKKSGILRRLNDIYFVDENIGYAVGDNDYILKTSDGGETWRYQVIPHAFVGNMKAVYFASPHRGWVVGSDETRGAIYATTDGGHSWNRAPLFGVSMTGMHFNDMNQGWAVDESGKIYRFDDNATGAGDTSFPFPAMDFIPVADTLFNFDRSKFTLIDSVAQGGVPFLGKNGSGHEEFGEKYIAEGETWIAGVMVYHHGKAVHGNNVAEYNVFSVDGMGYPDRKIGRKDIYFKDIDLSKNASSILFNEPVLANGSFFVTFNLTDYYHGGFDGDDIGIMHTSNKSRPQADEKTRNVVRVHDHSDRVWRPIEEANYTSGYRGHLAIFPIIYRKDLVTGVEDRTAEAGGLKLYSGYPNPTRDKITFSYSLQQPSHVATMIYNMKGESVRQKEVERREPGLHKEEYEMTSLAPGLYIYKVQAGNVNLTSKFIVTH